MPSQSASLALDLPARLQLPWQARRLVRHLAKVRRGSLVVDLHGRRFTLGGQEAGPAAAIRVHRPGALLRRLFWRGDLGFGEAFVAGDWESADPATLLELMAINLDAFAGSGERHLMTRVLSALQHWRNRNSRSGSRRNIAAHYDLGNDFYREWLDPGMTYSSAVFDGGGTLEQAQQRKYERMLALVAPSPGQHILEIGCGWGGFAEYAARRGYRVTGLTLSREQLAYARQRIAHAGLADRVELRLCDYRDFDEQVDHVVSIEMFEAVGRAYWETYFASLARCLRPGGRVALQVITIDAAQFDDYAANPGGFIQTYIFPGGMLPTEDHLARLGRDSGLEATVTHRYGADYAATLAHWHDTFNACTGWLEAHGYDARFRRMWRYYLAFCEAGFRAGHIDVVQCAFRKP